MAGNRRWLLWALAGVLSISVLGCKKKSRAPGNSPVPSASGGPGRAAGSVKLVVAYGSEKKSWFEEQARAFEASGARTKSSKTIQIEGKAMGSGEAMRAIVDGKLQAHVFSPASGVYISLLNQAWLSTAGHTKPLSPAGEALVLSPIVIAMWKPMAEALGWPGKQLGWKDLLEVNANPGGWGAHGHAEWGRFKLGHTHPRFSNSGVLAVLAEAYAGAGKRRGLTAADLDQKPTQDFIAKVEATIVHYGKSTGFFADKMIERGPEYISAAVLYENLVIESYSKKSEFPVVAIYPVEGTFWSDHPYAVLDAEWVGADEQDAAAQLLAFLKAKPAQQRALELGFRPGDPSIAIGAPVDAAHGVDAKQPETLLEVPDAEVLEKLLVLWDKSKKAADVVLVFDKSGSMKGQPLAEAKTGGQAFLDNLHDNDDVTLMFFDTRPGAPIGPLKLGPARANLKQRIGGALADGGTSLYDSTAAAYKLATARAAKEKGRIHAVVVMTDGRDEHSEMTLEQLKGSFRGEGGDDVKVFTIAYGDGADTGILAGIAEAAGGSTAKGDVNTIIAVFQDMASFF